jgi:hypothetical protein
MLTTAHWKARTQFLLIEWVAALMFWFLGGFQGAEVPVADVR